MLLVGLRRAGGPGARRAVCLPPIRPFLLLESWCVDKAREINQRQSAPGRRRNIYLITDEPDHDRYLGPH
eukprot:scaffold25598_cov56-Phaeocystis_antarctica.AAC.1